jgi:hypothetical protein
MDTRNVASRGRPASAPLALALLASAVVSCTVNRPCAAQSPSFLGRWPANQRGMPAYSRPLPAGNNKLVVKNPFHFKVMAQVRFGNQGQDFVLEGKSSKELLLPDGEYTVYFRSYYDLRVQEGRSFTAKGGGITFDDEDEENLLTKAHDRGAGRRKDK